jgi:hypothetical protein
MPQNDDEKQQRQIQIQNASYNTRKNAAARPGSLPATGDFEGDPQDALKAYQDYTKARARGIAEGAMGGEYQEAYKKRHP